MMELQFYSNKFIHYYLDELPPLLMSLIEDNKGFKTVADLGCGDGSILYALNKNGLLEHFDKIYAVDLSEERIRRVRRLNNKIYCLIADVCDLHKLKDNEIDLIISNQIIEHVSNDELMIKEMARVLNREGLIYLSTVFKKRYGWYFYRNRKYQWVIDPTHEREYTSDNPLLTHFDKNNLEIVQNKKSLHWFSLTDFVLKRIGFKQNIYENSSILKFLRKIKVPILGYYNWEIVCQKR